MLVFDIEYAGYNEHLSFLVEDNENAVHVALEVMRQQITERKIAHEELLVECLGNSQCERYHTSTRLMLALEYVFTINDLRDINYVNVKTRIVHSQD